MEQIYFSDLSNYTTEARGVIDRIYLHWTAGFYDQQFDDYHINIDGDGNIFIDGRLIDKKEHTWRRNTGAIGIALDCCYKAKPSNLGDYPPTPKQLDVMAKIVAKLCLEIGIAVDDSVYTHDEIADNADGVTWLYEPYGYNSTCERWDLHGMGDEIRENAKKYIDIWLKGYKNA